MSSTAKLRSCEGHAERLHVHPVAGQYAAMIAPAGIGRGTAAPRVGAVDHVIVDERRAVDQFHHGAQVNRAGSAVPGVSGREQQERRTQALAAATEQVAGDLGNGLAGGAGLAGDFLLDLRQVVAHQIEYLFDRQHSDDFLRASRGHSEQIPVLQSREILCRCTPQSDKGRLKLP